jgi:UDP-N-acetylglucosamine--N-acetylmuramyl-(pentapeptide) pyrophosphoryl-undecaprenol N-acetylglucosamine transferase
VALSLKGHARDVVWLGTRLGIEARVVPAAGIPMEWVNVQGLRGKGALALLVAPIRLTRATLQSLSVMRRHRPAAVLGMGGFVSGPGGLAAWLTRRPLVVHEQNAVSGLTNRLLARLARVVLQAFPGSFSPRVHAETVGNPVRREIAELPDPATRFGHRSGPLRLLVLGGSQGALALNRAVPAAIACMPHDRRPLVWHQAGERTLDAAREAYHSAAVEVELVSFIDNMADAYAWADLVVCRAGALTVAELSAAGVGAIFVPFPAAVDDHQSANAAPLVRAGAAELLQERELTATSLADLLQSLLSNREQLLERAVRARTQAKPDALARITEVCLELAGAQP